MLYNYYIFNYRLFFFQSEHLKMHKEDLKFPVVLYPCQHLVLLISFMLAILINV